MIVLESQILSKATTHAAGPHYLVHLIRFAATTAKKGIRSCYPEGYRNR